MTQPRPKGAFSLRMADAGAVMAAAAVVTSAIATFIAWDQSQILRAQQHAAAMPILSVDFDAVIEDGLPVMQVRVRNNGVGPALIAAATLHADGEPVSTFSAFNEKILSDFALQPPPSVRIDRTDGVLAPGAESTPLRLRWFDESLVEPFVPFAYSLVSNGRVRVDYVVCYCSIYDDCWKAAVNGGAKPEPVDRCPANKPDLYQTFMAAEEAPDQ